MTAEPSDTPPATPVAAPTGMAALLLRVLGPARTFLARFAYVEQEGRLRDLRLRETEDRTLRRTDLVVQELWRRMEGADSRNATAIQQLVEEVADLRREQQRVRGLLERNGGDGSEA